jgi:hypothetical protein
MTTTAVAAIPTYNWYQTGGVNSYCVRSIVNKATSCPAVSFTAPSTHLLRYAYFKAGPAVNSLQEG